MDIIQLSIRHEFEHPDLFGPLRLRPHSVSAYEAIFPRWTSEVETGRLPMMTQHGFNSRYADVARNIAELGAGLGDGLLLSGIWPGGDRVAKFRWAALERAPESGHRFALATQWAAFAIKNQPLMDLGCHSLGNDVGCTLIDEFRECSTPIVRHFFMMAPAVDWDCFEPGKRFEHVPQACEHVWICCARTGSDKALLVYPVGDPGHDRALGWMGPADMNKLPPNVHLVTCKSVEGHSGFNRTPEFLEWMRRVRAGEVFSRHVTV